MKQLELFDGLQPVKKWLHVWTDAERERNKAVTQHALPAVPVCRVGKSGSDQADSQPGRHACRLKGR